MCHLWSAQNRAEIRLEFYGEGEEGSCLGLSVARSHNGFDGGETKKQVESSRTGKNPKSGERDPPGSTLPAILIESPSGRATVL